MTHAQRVLIVAALFLIPVFQAVGQDIDNTTVLIEPFEKVRFSACLVTSVSALSQSQLWNLNNYYIVPESNQKGAAHDLIADALLASELNVSIGAIDGIPEDTDVLVDYRSKWEGFFGLDTSLRDLVIFFRAPSTNELLGVAQLISEEQDSSMGLVYVRSSIAELLGLLEQPEGAPQC